MKFGEMTVYSLPLGLDGLTLKASVKAYLKTNGFSNIFYLGKRYVEKYKLNLYLNIFNSNEQN